MPCLGQASPWVAGCWRDPSPGSLTEPPAGERQDGRCCLGSGRLDSDHSPTTGFLCSRVGFSRTCLQAPSALMQPHLGMLQEKRIRDSFRPEVLKLKCTYLVVGEGLLTDYGPHSQRF